MTGELFTAGVEKLRAEISSASRQGRKIGSLDFGGLTRILQHNPADMTVTVEGGTKLSDLQQHVGQHGQWLPLDPADPAATISEIIQQDLSGPRRLGYGTVRDHLLGIHVLLADGQLIKGGGQVVKNVAGYDLCKLFVGSQGTLGVVVAAVFKLQPLPERENLLHLRFESFAEAERCLRRLRGSEINPVLLEFHNISPSGMTPQTSAPPSCELVAGFAGAHEDVEQESAEAIKAGLVSGGGLEHERMMPQLQQKLSVLPSRLFQALQLLPEGDPFIARAGNGVIRYSHAVLQGTVPHLPMALLHRTKKIFDPDNVFPELRL